MKILNEYGELDTVDTGDKAEALLGVEGGTSGAWGEWKVTLSSIVISGFSSFSGSG